MNFSLVYIALTKKKVAQCDVLVVFVSCYSFIPWLKTSARIYIYELEWLENMPEYCSKKIYFWEEKSARVITSYIGHSSWIKVVIAIHILTTAQKTVYPSSGYQRANKLLGCWSFFGKSSSLDPSRYCLWYCLNIGRYSCVTFVPSKAKRNSPRGFFSWNW